MNGLSKRVIRLERSIKPDAVPMVHYVYLDENDQAAYMDIPEPEFRAGQLTGKYPPAHELIEVILHGDNPEPEEEINE